MDVFSLNVHDLIDHLLDSFLIHIDVSFVERELRGRVQLIGIEDQKPIFSAVIFSRRQFFRIVFILVTEFVRDGKTDNELPENALVIIQNGRFQYELRRHPSLRQDLLKIGIFHMKTLRSLCFKELFNCHTVVTFLSNVLLSMVFMSFPLSTLPDTKETLTFAPFLKTGRLKFTLSDAVTSI